MISRSAEYKYSDYHFARSRQDSIYIPLEKSQPNFMVWRLDILAALAVVALGYVAFPVAAWLAVVVAEVFP